MTMPGNLFERANQLRGDFMTTHGDWWQGCDHSEPVYHLPECIVRYLCAPRDSSQGLITPAEAEAERAYADFCRSHGPTTVGIWKAKPIRHPLFTCFSGLENHAPAKPVPIEKERNRQQGLQELDSESKQRLGYLGDRLLDPTYREELAKLKAHWERLDQPDVFPLLARTADLTSEPSKVSGAAKRLPPVVAEFVTAASQFLRKHQMLRLITWQLAVPAGRLEGLSAAFVSHARGPDTPVFAIPAQENIPTSVDVRSRVRKVQATHGEESGLGTRFPVAGTSPRDGQLAEKAQIFLMWFVEHVARSRYSRRRGMVKRVSQAFREYLAGDPLNPANKLPSNVKQLSEARVSTLRKDYTKLF